jgi:hypothetical protein
MKSWLLAAALTTLAACASAPSNPETTPAASRAVDPAGMYDFNTTVDGSAVTGVVTITRGPSGHTGTITTNVTDPITIDQVTAEGNRITVIALTPDGALTFTMDFSGDDFSGTWTLGEMSGTHTGRRRTS